MLGVEGMFYRPSTPLSSIFADVETVLACETKYLFI